MKSTLIKVCASVLAIMMCVVCFAACGSKDTGDTTTTPAPATTTPAPDTTTEATTTEATTTEATTTTEKTTEATTEATQEPVDDGKLDYKVIVVDEAGNPMAGAMVQICEGTACNPGVTNAEGVALIRAVEGNYEAKMLSMPEGYTYATEEEVFPFADGALEVTIVLKNAA